MFVAPVSFFKGGAEVVLMSMVANPHIDAVLAVPEDGPVAEAGRALGIKVCCYYPGVMMEVHRPPRPGPMMAARADAVRCAFRLRRLARLNGCDLLHSNGLKPHVLCAILGVTRTRTLVHLHDIPHKRAERVIWKFLARCVTRVILVSRPCFPGRLPRNVEVVPNGIALVEERLPEAATVGGAGVPIRLGFVGRFHPNKGLDLLLDWFKAVRQAGLAATLTIRGRPDPDMPEYWDRIRTRISAEELEPDTKLDGWVTGKAAYAGAGRAAGDVRDTGPGAARGAGGDERGRGGRGVSGGRRRADDRGRADRAAGPRRTDTGGQAGAR